MNKKKVASILIIIGILIISYFALKQKNPETPTEIVKCIGENSVLYSQLGCSACKKQEELFGENYQYLNEIDCFYEVDKCSEIRVTPTWIIKGQKYEGVQTIEELKKLTEC